MPDRYGRPQFQDFQQVNRALMGMSKHAQDMKHQQKVRQRQDQEYQNNQQAMEIGNFYAQNPDAFDKHPNKLPQFQGYSEEAKYKGRALGYKLQADKRTMESAKSQAQLDMSKLDSMRAQKHIANSQLFAETGDKGLAAQELIKGFSSMTNGYKFQVGEPEEGGEPMINMVDPDGKVTKSMPYSEAMQTIKENPEVLRPEKLAEMQAIKNSAFRQKNLKAQFNPKRYVDRETGKDVGYETVQYNKETGEPEVIISREPLYYGDKAEILEVRDLDGAVLADRYKELKEAQDGKIDAYRDEQRKQYKAMTDTLETYAEPLLQESGLGGGIVNMVSANGEFNIDAAGNIHDIAHGIITRVEENGGPADQREARRYRHAKDYVEAYNTTVGMAKRMAYEYSGGTAFAPQDKVKAEKAGLEGKSRAERKQMAAEWMRKQTGGQKPPPGELKKLEAQATKKFNL